MSGLGVAEIQSLDAFWQSLCETASDGCHLALIDISDRLAEGGLGNAAWRDVLCSEERARLDNFKCGAAAWEYEASHVALRLVLGRGLGVPASEVPFRRPGEPFQPPEPAATGSFVTRASLSHSGRFAAVAVSRDLAVGVDVEPLSRAEQAQEVVRMFLCEQELARLAEMPAEQRATAALRAWCLKEAALKAVGTGFQTDPKTIRLDINPDAAHQVVALEPAGGPSLSLRTMRHPAAPDALVALALEKGCVPVRFSYTSLWDLVCMS